MAKDAKGHGSDARGSDAKGGAQADTKFMFKGGGSIGAMMKQAKALDARDAAERGELGSAHPANSGEAHVQSIAAAHGVPTDHLDRSFAGVMARNPGYGNLRAKSEALASERLSPAAQRARDDAYLAKTPSNSREINAPRAKGK